MNVLVTGGAGYIGSHCVRELLDQGHTVTIIDNLSTGYLQAIDERAKFYNADIRKFDKVMSILINNNIDAVIHFAAFSLVGESMENPLKYYDNNVYGTKVLLDAMAEANVNKIVFSSTAAVYGAQDVMPITEEVLETPSNAYGETKLAMEKMMKWSDIANDTKYVALRYFNVAGAHHSGEIGESHNPETHLIPLILQVPLGKREFISIFGTDYDTPDGTCIRDYIHIEDLISAHIKALEYLDKGNESNTFNLGSGQGYSVLEMIEAARTVTGHKIPAKLAERRAGDPARLIASSDKAITVLGWERNYTDVQDIIASAWTFHLNFKEGFNNDKHKY
jgi:UDP-glucose 4-epimerase